MSWVIMLLAAAHIVFSQYLWAKRPEVHAKYINHLLGSAVALFVAATLNLIWVLT